MATKRIVLSEEERKFEEEYDRGEWKPVSPAKKAELLAKVREAYQNLKKGRGGARPNAGRKPLGRIHLTVNIKPETRALLLREAGGSVGMGAVIDKWAAAQSHGKPLSTR